MHSFPRLGQSENLKQATSNKGIATSNKGITTSSKKLPVTSATSTSRMPPSVRTKMWTRFGRCAFQFKSTWSRFVWTSPFQIDLVIRHFQQLASWLSTSHELWQFKVQRSSKKKMWPLSHEWRLFCKMMTTAALMPFHIGLWAVCADVPGIYCLLHALWLISLIWIINRHKKCPRLLRQTAACYSWGPKEATWDVDMWYVLFDGAICLWNTTHKHRLQFSQLHLTRAVSLYPIRLPRKKIEHLSLAK